MLYLLTITLDDLEGLRTTISSLENFFCDDQVIHVIKNGRINDASSSYVKSLSSNKNKIVLIEEPDSGIYDAMNRALSVVPVDEWFVFLNSGDCLHGYLALDREAKCFVSDAYYLKKDVSPYEFELDSKISVNKSYYNGMPFCHQSLFMKKRVGMIFNTNYTISSDYLFVLREVMSLFPSSPRSVPFNSSVRIGYDACGISSQRKLRRDYESFQILVKYMPLSKSVIYAINRLLSLPRYVSFKINSSLNINKKQKV